MIAPPIVSFQARRVARLSRPAEAYDRSLRLRIGLAWGLVFLNVLTFYKGTWNGLPLIVPIPSKVGQFITQGSLPAAVLVAWSANRRMLIRPNVFLSLLSLLLIEALIAGIQRPATSSVPCTGPSGSVSSWPCSGCFRHGLTDATFCSSDAS